MKLFDCQYDRTVMISHSICDETWVQYTFFPFSNTIFFLFVCIWRVHRKEASNSSAVNTDHILSICLLFSVQFISCAVISFFLSVWLITVEGTQSLSQNHSWCSWDDSCWIRSACSLYRNSSSQKTVKRLKLTGMDNCIIFMTFTSMKNL